MYRLFIASKDDEKYGINTGLTPCEFFLESADDVCKVISELSHCKMVYTLAECSVSSVDDVLSCFMIKDIQE